MPSLETNLIARRSFETADLVAAYPPQFHHANKQILYDYICPPACRHTGQLAFTRWRAFDLPADFHPADARAVLEVREGFYGYELPAEGCVEWYVNFADPDLFGSYGLGVFAQDEIQVAEHPALASLREALPKIGIRPLTVEKGVPTPILIMGAERRCAVATDRNEAAGRPRGLYGRQFALAAPEIILQSTTRIEPPTLTNLIAMAAPSYGRGVYTEEQIRLILTTAFTGFAAACIEARPTASPGVAVIVHTGFWGCGAFGGNRILMALLQLLAAHLSGIDRLVFHAPDAEGREDVEEARSLLEEKILSRKQTGGWLSRLRRSLAGAPGRASARSEEPIPIDTLVAKIAAEGFQWGTSDGN